MDALQIMKQYAKIYDKVYFDEIKQVHIFKGNFNAFR